MTSENIALQMELFVITDFATIFTKVYAFKHLFLKRVKCWLGLVQEMFNP
jgi:hypothetical protein